MTGRRMGGIAMKPKQAAPLLLLALIWGIYYVASHKSVERMSVFTVGIVIRLLTMVLLTAVMLWKRELPSLLRVKGVFARLLLIGLMGFLLDLTAFVGLSLSPAGAGTALLKTDILFVNLISVIIYKQKFTGREWIDTFVMLFGVLLVMDFDFLHASLGGKGDIFFILSALFVSINAFLIKSVQRSGKNPVSNDVIAYYNNFVTMILFTVTACMMGTIGQLRLFGTDPGITLGLVVAGLGQTGVYIVYYYDLARFPVWLVKVFLLFMPIVSTVLSFLLFGETLTGKQLLGVAVVLAGAMGVLFEQRKKEEGHLAASM